MKDELKHRELTDKIIAAAIAVHRELGPGFLESVYEEALCVEFEAAGIPYERQKAIPIYYRAKNVGEHRLDLLVADAVVVELKAVKALEDIFFSTVRSYMKACGRESGLLFNFATMPLTVKRVGRERPQPDASEVETQHWPSQPPCRIVHGLHGVVDHLIVHRAAVERVGVADHCPRHGFLCIDTVIKPLQFELTAGEYDTFRLHSFFSILAPHHTLRRASTVFSKPCSVGK